MTTDTNEPDTVVVERSIGIASIGALHRQICQRLSQRRETTIDLSQFDAINFCLIQLLIVSAKSFSNNGVKFFVFANNDVIERSLSRVGVGSL